MKKRLLSLCLSAALALTAGATANAFNLPPMNLGLTDILDGGPPGPGNYFNEYVQVYSSHSFRDANGEKIPGAPKVSTLLSMNQLVHVCPKPAVLGAHPGVTLLQPVVAISAENAPVNPSTMGDLTVGPFLQWFDTKLAGRPFLQRLEVDVTMPTGQYDKKYALNPGSNHWTVEPFYAFTWFLTPELSTSWRLHYQYNGENDDTKVQPGQAFHANWSAEYAFTKALRGGLSGYYLKQLTEDELNGVKGTDTKEQAFAFGPSIFWIANDHFMAGVKTAWESNVENRPQGTRSTLRFTYKF